MRSERRRRGPAGRAVPSGRFRAAGVFLLLALLAAPAALAQDQGTVPVRPIVDPENGVLGAELYTGLGSLEFFGGAGYGLFTDGLQYRAGATWSSLRQRLTLSYQDWPGSPVQGRKGQTGASLRWHLNPSFGSAIELTGFRGSLWPVEGEEGAPETWLLGAEASQELRLGDAWSVIPQWTATWGQTLDAGHRFTSHLATVQIRRGWTGLQLAAGTLWTDGLEGFAWRLGGGGKVPLRGYEPEYDEGEWLLGLSLEQRVPLPVNLPLSQLQAAFFVDAADALAAGQDLQDVTLAVGYGAGLVVATVLGELHAELGWNPQGEAVPSIWLSTSF